jgi:type VI secretion system secreted protein VgrG
MKTPMFVLAVLATVAAAPSIAGPLDDRVDVLSAQVLTLQREIAVLKSMLGRDATGNVAFTATGGRTDRVALNASSTVGGNSASSVGGAATQTVGGNALTTVYGSSTTNVAVNSLANVGGSATRQVGGSSSDTVNGNASQQVGGSMGVAVASNLTLEAGDQLTLKSGSSTIVLKKNGEITISGASVRMLGSAEVLLKAPKVLTN